MPFMVASLYGVYRMVVLLAGIRVEYRLCKYQYAQSEHAIHGDVTHIVTAHRMVSDDSRHLLDVEMCRLLKEKSITSPMSYREGENIMTHANGA